MADIVNLRRFRKAHARAQAAKAADANRAAFGRTIAERLWTVADAAQAARRLDGHRLSGFTELSASISPVCLPPDSTAVKARVSEETLTEVRPDEGGASGVASIRE